MRLLASVEAHTYTEDNIITAKDRSLKARFIFSTCTMLAILGGCAKSHDLDESGGVAITRSRCPAVAVPVDTGDVTLFNPVDSTDSRAIDVTAVITNIRSSCNDDGGYSTASGKHHKKRPEAVQTGDITSSVAFDVEARRTDSHGTRDVVLPYYSVVMQGGNIVITKRVNSVRLHFDDGQARASAPGTAGASIDRAAASLPLDVITKINRKRKSGQDDAAEDPLADPHVREQLARANFELLIGFQLTDNQLKYNATR